MPTTKEITVYNYDELSEKAKEKARNAWRESNLDYDWWDSVYEDAADVADILGIDLRQKRVTLGNGSWRTDPEIYFTGFYHQGSGSSYCATYRYANGAVRKIKAYAPRDTELHRIAMGLQEVQRRNFYRLRTEVRSHRDTRICVSVWDSHDEYRDLGDSEDDITTLLNDFNDWIFTQLEKEYEWLTSDEQVEESLRDSEYEFDEDGSFI